MTTGPTSPSTGANHKPTLLASLSRWPGLWIGLLCFALYARPALGAIQLDPDAIQFADIARNLLSGDGYVLRSRSFHFAETTVVHNGLVERAPLFTYIVAAFFGLGLDLRAVQLLNAALAGCSAGLVYAIGSELFGRRVGLVSGALAAASPAMLIFMLPPLSEAPAIALALLATWLVIRHVAERSRLAFLMAGIVLGLGYLTRPTTGALVVALVPAVLIAAPSWRLGFRQIGWLLGGVMIVAGPITLHSLVTRGSLSYSLTYLFSVYRDTAAISSPPFTPQVPAAQFIAANVDFVLATSLSQTRSYLQLLFLDGKWLLYLLPAWPVAFYLLARRRYPRAIAVPLLVASASFLAYAATWSTYQRRYLLLSLLLLLPIAVDAVARLGLERLRLPRVRALSALHLYALVVVALWSGVLIEQYAGIYRYGDERVPTASYHGVRFSGATHWVEDRDLTRITDWVRSRTEQGDVIAHVRPEIFTYFAERPSTRLPPRLEPPLLRRFLVEDRVAYVLLSNYAGYRRMYESSLEELHREGVEEVALGEYRIFDTRALWRAVPSPR